MIRPIGSLNFGPRSLGLLAAGGYGGTGPPGTASGRAGPPPTGLPAASGIDQVSMTWWAGHMAGPTAFVGREGELSMLLGALARDTRLVLVAGDAGVGKTQFVEMGIARATAAGMVLLRGECLP